MNKRFWALGLSCFIVIAAQSVFFGAVGDPGSQEDPVITQSFFANATSGINTSISQLNTSVAGANTKISNLEARIATLEKASSSAVTDSDLRIIYHLNKMNYNKKYGATSVSGLQLKASPSTTSATLTTLGYYSGVSILDADAGWFKIKYYSYVGWIPYDKLIPIMVK